MKNDYKKIEKLLRISTSTIADILDSLGIYLPIDQTIKNINGQNNKLAGIAHTVAWKMVRKSEHIKHPQKSSWEQVRNFLLPNQTIGQSSIYVSGCDGKILKNFALAGGMSCKDFENRGFKGVLLGGGIRDADDIRDLKIPVFSSGFTPYDTQGCYEVYSVGTWCYIGSTRINTGDYIVSDNTGTVVIPRAIVSNVIQKGIHIENTEKKIKQKLEQRYLLHKIVDRVGRI